MTVDYLINLFKNCEHFDGFKIGAGLLLEKSNSVSLVPDGEEIVFFPFTDTIDSPQNLRNLSNSMISNATDENIIEKQNKFNLQLFATDTSVSDKIFAQIDKLNDVGLQKALEQIELLTKIQEYLK